MNREIKFRAWWTHSEYLPEGKMYYAGVIDWTQPQEGEPECYLHTEPQTIGLMKDDNEKIGWNSADECVLMQYQPGTLKASKACKNDVKFLQQYFSGMWQKKQ
jgi:hypothetical protein